MFFGLWDFYLNIDKHLYLWICLFPFTQYIVDFKYHDKKLQILNNIEVSSGSSKLLDFKWRREEESGEKVHNTSIQMSWANDGFVGIIRTGFQILLCKFWAVISIFWTWVMMWNLSCFVHLTYVVESIRHLNFRFGIQTEIQFWPLKIFDTWNMYFAIKLQNLTIYLENIKCEGNLLL